MKSTLLSLFAIALLSGSTNACVSGHQQCLNQTDFRMCAHGNWQVPQLILTRYVQNEDTVYPGQLESPGSDGQPGNNGNNGQPGRNDPPSQSTPQTYSALELVNACLDRSSHIVETSCKPVENTDQARYYQCLCHNAREVAVCYNNCPNMVAEIAAQEGQVSHLCGKASTYDQVANPPAGQSDGTPDNAKQPSSSSNVEASSSEGVAINDIVSGSQTAAASITLLSILLGTALYFDVSVM